MDSLTMSSEHVRVKFGMGWEFRTAQKTLVPSEMQLPPETWERLIDHQPGFTQQSRLGGQTPQTI